MPISKATWQRGLDSQTACNLSGLAHWLPRLLDEAIEWMAASWCAAVWGGTVWGGTVWMVNIVRSSRRSTQRG